MTWRSVDAVLEPVEEELKVWNRADLDRSLGGENRSLGASAAIYRRNILIRSQHDNGASLADLMEAYDLSQRQVLRVLAQRR